MLDKCDHDMITFWSVFKKCVWARGTQNYSASNKNRILSPVDWNGLLLKKEH